MQFKKIRIYKVKTALIAIMAFALPLNGQKEDEQLKGNGLGLRVDYLKFKFLPAPKVKNVPEFVRQVPIHEDDAGAGRVRTIPFDNLDPWLETMYSPSIGPEFRLGKFKLSAGIGISVPLTPAPKRGNSGSTREISQWFDDSDRGYGTALVFYGLNNVVIRTPYWYGEIEYLATRRFGLLAGFSEEKYRSEFVSGWDRYDALQQFKRYKVSDNKLDQVYSGFRFYDSRRDNSLSLYLGFGKKVSRFSSEFDSHSLNIPSSNGVITIGFGITRHF